MKIAVVNETSSADKNADILAALEGRGHQVVNAGMTRTGATPELSYIHTGLIAAILLNLKRADLVVGGCGTGQGFASAAGQYPGVFCGYVTDALDAWLFAQINGGNCISLRLNQGYGWGADINLRFIFDRLFSVEWGRGYPTHRQTAQRQARETLERVSVYASRPFSEIIAALPNEVIIPVIEYPGIKELIDVDSVDDADVRAALLARM